MFIQEPAPCCTARVPVARRLVPAYDISIVFQTSAESVGDGVQLVPGMIGNPPYFPSTISTCWPAESAGALRRISQGKPLFWTNAVMRIRIASDGVVPSSAV